MRTILHIGMPKTGTTTLQNSLHAAKAALARHGVLYPSLADLGHQNHHPLILDVLPPDALPRQFRFLPEVRRARLATRASDLIAAEIAARPPACLLLSTEYLSRHLAPEELDRLSRLLDRFGVTDLIVSVYVRRPSAHYLSLLTQALRQSAAIPPPGGFDVRGRVQRIEAVFPGARIVPALFERELLTGGDIVPDFVARFLAPFGVAPADVPPVAQANASVSGEATAVLRAFRQSFFPGRDHSPERASATLYEELARIEAAIGPRRPRLRAEVAQYIDGTSGDVAWLRDAYGLTFPGLEPSTPPDLPEVRDLADVLELDPDYRARLLDALEHGPWARKPWRRAWVRSLAAGHPAPPARWRVLRRLLGD